MQKQGTDLDYNFQNIRMEKFTLPSCRNKKFNSDMRCVVMVHVCVCLFVRAGVNTHRSSFL